MSFKKKQYKIQQFEQIAYFSIFLKKEHSTHVFFIAPGIAIPNLVPFIWTTTPAYQISMVLFVNLGGLEGYKGEESCLSITTDIALGSVTSSKCTATASAFLLSLRSHFKDQGDTKE